MIEHKTLGMHLVAHQQQRGDYQLSGERSVSGQEKQMCYLSRVLKDESEILRTEGGGGGAG